jgi:hypothetical protein
MSVLPFVLARLAARVLPMALGAAVSAPPAPPPAPAGSAGWRLVARFGRPGGFSEATSIAATGRDDAWAATQLCGKNCRPDLGVLRWDGRSWRSVPVPDLGRLPQNLPFPAVAASSASNAWVFANTRAGKSARSSALHWTGRRWTVTRLPGSAVISGAAVLGPADAWAFGTTGSGGALAPYDLHYSGRGWHRVRLPAVPYAASALGPRDIWALAVTTRTLHDLASRQVTVALHFDGRRWHTLSLPAIRRRPGAALIPGPIVAVGPGQAWFPVLVMSASGNLAAGRLLHRDGGRWQQARMPYKDFTNGAAADGHGGLWLSDGFHLDHYARGRWTTQVPPAPRGQHLFVNALTGVRGTRTDWAAGLLLPSETGAIYRYRP